MSIYAAPTRWTAIYKLCSKWLNGIKHLFSPYWTSFLTLSPVIVTIQTTAAGGEKHDNKCTLILLLWAQHLLSCFLRGNAAPSILWHRSDFIALLSFNLAAFISFACIIALGSILLPSSAGPVLCPLAACKGHSVSPPTHQLTLSLRLKPSATPPHPIFTPSRLELASCEEFMIQNETPKMSDASAKWQRLTDKRLPRFAEGIFSILVSNEVQS